MLPRPEPLGGLILYRHGDRLSTVHSADAPGVRTTHPGVMHLLRWRAIQLAIREGRDRDGPRRRGHGPDHARARREGTRWRGCTSTSARSGRRWVEMTGAHERVMSPRALRPRRLVTPRDPAPGRSPPMSPARDRAPLGCGS